MIKRFFDRFKTKYSDEELLKMNNEMVRMNKKDGNAYWNTHGVPIQDKLYNMSPEETSPEIRKAIAIKACSIFKSCLSKIKDPNFRKAVSFRKPSNAELNEWIETGEGLWFGNWNLWTFTPKARTDTDSNIYFWNIMQGFLNECNIRLGNRSFKIESDGDWDDGAIGLVDRTVTTESYSPVQETNTAYSKNTNFFISENDIYCNMGRFLKKSPNQVNICFVTGFSGSGKSTVAKKLAKYHKITYVELDYFSFRGAHRPFTEKDCKDSGHEIIWEYIKRNGLSPSFLVGVDKYKAKWIEAITNFVRWLEIMPGNYVVEGIQCTYIIPANPKWLDYPIIFKGTSMVTSLIRGLKRDEIIDLKHIRTTVIDILDRIKWFYSSKSGFDNIRNSMIEKDNHREVPDSVWDEIANEAAVTYEGENMKSTHDEMSALMEMLYDDTDKHHLKKFVQENCCLPDTSLLGIEPTMEKTVTYGEELAPKNMNHFKIREDRKDMTRGYMDPEVIYNPPKNFKNLDQISGLELQTFKGFRKLDDDIKMIFHSGSDYNCIGYVRCPETGIQLTKRWMPEASGRIERYDYYIKDSKGHGGKFELWFNPDRHYASEAALVLEASAHGEEISMQDVKRKIRFVEGDKGTMNSVYVMNGKQYRVRVETLVVRNLHGEPHIFFQKKDTPSSYGQMYKLPGGSVEPNKDWATQASAECNEEILTKVKNIRYTGVSYIKEYPPGKTPSWQRASVLYQKGVDYTGAITFVFVAEYDGPYKKYVHAIDRDSLAKEGKWYPVKDFNHLCNDEHKGIIYGVKLVSDEHSADAMTEGFRPIEEVSVVRKITGKIFGKDKQATKERQMSAERLKRRKDVVNHTFDFVGKFLAKTLKNPEFARCFTKDESMLRKWEQGGGKYTTVLYWDKKRFKGSDEEWNKCYKAFRREVSMHRTDVKGFSIGCARGSNSSNGLIQLTDHSKLWRPLNEVFATKEDYSLMGSLPKKKIHRKVVSRHAMNGKNKVKIVSQEQQYPDWF